MPPRPSKRTRWYRPPRTSAIEVIGLRQGIQAYLWSGFTGRGLNLTYEVKACGLHWPEVVAGDRRTHRSPVPQVGQVAEMGLLESYGDVSLDRPCIGGQPGSGSHSSKRLPSGSVAQENLP